MKFNLPTRRLLARLQNVDSPQVVDATEPAVHTLAKAGLICKGEQHDKVQS